MRHQRSTGTGRLTLTAGGTAVNARLATLYQEGCAKIRLPKVPAGGAREAILINTSGGLAGGDRLGWEIDIGAGASASLTSQACERAYRSSGDAARLQTTIRLGEDARLAWLPQETILFDGARLTRSLAVEMAPCSRFLAAEAVLFGRAAMGETVGDLHFHDRWRVRRGGRLVHADDVAFSGPFAELRARRAVLGGAPAMATLLLVADDAERFLEPARRIVGEAGGVSLWEAGGAGKLLARLVAQSGYGLRRRLVPLIALLNDGAGVPKIWSS